MWNRTNFESEKYETNREKETLEKETSGKMPPKPGPKPKIPIESRSKEEILKIEKARKGKYMKSLFKFSQSN